jgi:subtilisin family serine protease
MEKKDLARISERNHDSLLIRGNKLVELEKVKDRFSVMSSNTLNQATNTDLISKIKGIDNVSPLSGKIFKAKTSPVEIDSAMAEIRIDPFNGIAHHAYRPKGTQGTVYYITDTITLRFAPESNLDIIQTLLAKYRLNFIKQYKESNNANTFLVQVTRSSGKNPIKIGNQLMNEKGVLFAEVNLINRFFPAYTPSDPDFHKQWYLNSQNGLNLATDASVNIVPAWDITTGTRNITIAIIDDGFEITHEDLVGVNKIVSPLDYIDNDSLPLPSGNAFHGTPCAGIALAEENDFGIVGAAPNCSFMPVRFSLTADDDLMYEIFEKTGSRADVISISWGEVPAYVPLPTLIYEMIENLTIAGGPRGKGCVICIAANNFNAPLNNSQNQEFIWRDFHGRIRHTTGPILNGYATHPHVITVAASTSLNRHAEYSNWGKEVSVCAPSNNYNPYDRQQYAQGLGIWTTDNESSSRGLARNSRFTYFGGTSAATPLVAGIAALVLSNNESLTAMQVKDILQSTANKIFDDDPDMRGDNRSQYNEMGHSYWFGYGKVDATKAVTLAEEMKSVNR